MRYILVSLKPSILRLRLAGLPARLDVTLTGFRNLLSVKKRVCDNHQLCSVTLHANEQLLPDTAMTTVMKQLDMNTRRFTRFLQSIWRLGSHY